jgi:hypothetical protein
MGGTTIWGKYGETVFTCVYWEESVKSNMWPIQIKLGTNHSCIKGIQVHLNEGTSPLPGGGGLNIFSFREPQDQKS